MSQLKKFSHALIAMMISTQAFAGAFDVASLDLATSDSGDLSPIVALANTAFVAARGGPVFTQDIALVSQEGDANYALIHQESNGSTGNFAAITQSGSTPSIAYIYQSGGSKGGNMAMIHQH